MRRELIPGVLASFGLFLLIQALLMPLFEWEVNTINISLSPAYEVAIPPLWITELGESVEGHYALTHASVSIGEDTCLNEEGLKIVVERSSRDQTLELMSIVINRVVLWLMFGALLVILLSGFYGAWSPDGHENRTMIGVIISIATIAVFFCFLQGIFRVSGPHGEIEYFGQVSYDCYGALTLNAKLSKIHSETLTMVTIGILSVLGAFGVTLRQVLAKVRQEQESPKPPVG